MKLFFFFSAFIILFVSCEKAEIPVNKPNVYGVITQVEMGGDYGNQLFYNIENNEVVRVNHRETWDLGFENGIDGKHIILNSAKLMSVAKTTAENLEDVTSSDGLTFRFDAPSGNIDSTAIHEWWNENVVYIIDRGFSTTGSQLGKIKIRFFQVNETEFEFQWSNLSGGAIITSSVPKNSATNFTAFSFANGGELRDIEPSTGNWQLCFTAYTHVYHDGTPYLVTGVISNRKNVEIAESNLSFQEIDYTSAVSAIYEQRINVIGFDWKQYDFDLSMFTVNSNRVFLLKDQNSKYYKLRFIDFYTETGVKGAPKFEVQELIP
jgi:hypothetical protein